MIYKICVYIYSSYIIAPLKTSYSYKRFASFYSVGKIHVKKSTYTEVLVQINIF